jgi:hypothetical protein
MKPTTVFTVIAEYSDRQGGGSFSCYGLAEDYFNLLLTQPAKPKYMSMRHFPDQSRNPPIEDYLVMEYDPEKGTLNHGIKVEYTGLVEEAERRMSHS